jgi:hypothetical protein
VDERAATAAAAMAGTVLYIYEHVLNECSSSSKRFLDGEQLKRQHRNRAQTPITFVHPTKQTLLADMPSVLMLLLLTTPGVAPFHSPRTPSAATTAVTAADMLP